MTRRRLLVFGLLAGLFVLGAGAWMLWPLASVITRENAAKIQVGMTLADVEAILGGPSRDETTGPVMLDDADGPIVPVLLPREFPNPDRPPAPRHLWQSDQVTITVAYSRDGRVTDYSSYRVRRVPENAIDVFRRWLHL